MYTLFHFVAVFYILGFGLSLTKAETQSMKFEITGLQGTVQYSPGNGNSQNGVEKLLKKNTEAIRIILDAFLSLDLSSLNITQKRSLEYLRTGLPVVCPDATWTIFKGQCYKVFMDRKGWHGASKICGSFDGHLVEIHNAEVNNFLRYLVDSKKRVAYAWIGLNDMAKEGEYVWGDGLSSSSSKVGYTNWGIREPKKVHDTQDGAVMDFQGKWSMDPKQKADANFAREFICQMDAWTIV